jgi:capsule polysaccharide export protein KpsE/RkpR
VKSIDLFGKSIKVREYFNSEGFNRWNKIYSEVDDVNFVQKFIRQGHQQTIDKVFILFHTRIVICFTVICLNSETCAFVSGSQVDR